jgi:hypothetical protein
MNDSVLRARIKAVLDEVEQELLAAYGNFPDFRSAHEGVAIVEEEFLEFRNAAFWPHKEERHNQDEDEARQLAAMAVRYIIDVHCKTGTPR